MGDDDDRAALFLHRAEDFEEDFYLLRRQHGGRFVENQDLRAAAEDFQDFAGLFFRDRHIVYLAVGVELQAEFFLDFEYALGHFFAGGEKVLRERFNAVRDDVFLRGQDVDELEMLVNHSDSGGDRFARGREADLFAEQLDRSGVGLVDSRENVH